MLCRTQPQAHIGTRHAARLAYIVLKTDSAGPSHLSEWLGFVLPTGGRGFMKKCPYCGQQYSDEDSVCVIDHSPLESSDPKLPPLGSGDMSAQSASTDSESGSDEDSSDKFQSLGKFDPYDADHLLQKFLEAGIRFQIDRIERRVLTMGGIASGAGYIASDLIEIFVHMEDDQKAREILTADWKL